MDMMMTRPKMTKQQLIEFARKRIDVKLRYYVREGRLRECDAEDVAQDILVTILAKLQEYDAKHNACKKTFINAIVKNAFKYHFLESRWVKHQEHEDIDELPEDEIPTTERDGRMAETDRTALRLDLQSFRDKFLSPNQQQVFDLMGKCTQTEIARKLGLSQPRVYQLFESIKSAASETDLGDYF